MEYLRFGEIPENEESSIYCGEQLVGKEKGVSVYPCIINSDETICIGLSLPITRTTLHTFQALLQYDNRPLYLVKGDCIGKGIDGEPLLKNVKIVKEITNYRKKC